MRTVLAHADEINAHYAERTLKNKNILEASTYLKHELDDGRHPYAKRGWNYYKTVFVIPFNEGVKVYEGEIQIKLIERGDCFYDITKIRDITNGSAGQAYIKAAGSVEDISTYSISQNANLSTPDSENSNKKFALPETNSSGGKLTAEQRSILQTARCLTKTAGEIEARDVAIEFDTINFKLKKRVSKTAMNQIDTGSDRKMKPSTSSISQNADLSTENAKVSSKKSGKTEYSRESSGDGLNGREALTMGERYSYDNLVAKPDMKITIIDDTKKYEASAQTRKSIIDTANTNAISVGRFNSNGNAVIHVDDIETDVIVGKDGIRHSLDRRLNILAPVALNIGKILKNSIRINELNPRSENIKDSYILVGIAKNKSNEPYPVMFVVNKYSNEIISFDVLYSFNAKKESTPLNEAGVPDKKSDYLIDSTISISQLLDFVNKYFPDILPKDILKHYGKTERPKGRFNDTIRYSRDSEGDGLNGKAPLSMTGRTATVDRTVLQRDSQNQRLYLHNVIVKESTTFSNDDKVTTWSNENNDNLSITTILQKVIFVNSSTKKVSDDGAISDRLLFDDFIDDIFGADDGDGGAHGVQRKGLNSALFYFCT